MLLCKNVTVGDRRTSIRLEEEMWAAVGEVCRREGLTLHELCTLLDQCRGVNGLTAALRVFLVVYFRMAAQGESRAPFAELGGRRGRATDRWRPVLSEVFAS